MVAEQNDRRSWLYDPVVWIGALFGVAATAYALFAGGYVPYIDWSNHLGLIAVLAHGGTSGALDYLERSLAPSPYLGFYAISALFAQWVSVPVAAKLSILVSTFLLVPSAGSLAEATGRSPRLALIAPLAVFGVSMGFGFGSFVFATPFLFATLACFEHALWATKERRPRLLAGLAGILILTYLAHGLMLLVAVLLAGIRAIVRGLAAWREGARAVLLPSAWLGAALVPAFLVALAPTLAQVSRPEIEAGTAAPPGAQQIFAFEPLRLHFEQLGHHLLERGSSYHWTVMAGAVWLLVAQLALSMWRPLPRRDAAWAPREESRAIELYAAALVLLFLLGPISIEWPSSIWYVYPRFGVIAGIAVFLLPRVDLRGFLGWILCALALVAVGANAYLNGIHVRNFSGWASAYDPVRAAVPKGARVLALTVAPPGDFANIHPALGSLYFYHLCDGAAYTAFLFDKASLPVHSRAGVEKPRAPFWREPFSFDPATHGRDFDVLVLRGQGLVAKTRSAGLHELVAELNGWTVFRTKEPTPRPSVSSTRASAGSAPAPAPPAPAPH